MGGAGSGNRSWRHSKKTTVEDCLRIDANRWMREGILTAGIRVVGSWGWTYRDGKGFVINYETDTVNPDRASLRLSYSWVWSGSKRQGSADYRVLLTATRPRFGGLRWWFICPLSVNGCPCGRRVGKLYLPPSASYFGCRHCYGLTYTSCQDSHKFDGLCRLLARNMGVSVEVAKQALKDLEKRK
jgi:hypothetical protein